MITKQFPNAYRSLCLSLILLGVYVMSGCAANVTRSAPCTQLRPNMVQTPPLLKGCQLAVVQFDTSNTKIEGGHHEGLLQVRQPWIFGISKEQKEMLYGNAGQVAALSFVSELKNQGLTVTLLKDMPGASSKDFDLILTGKVERVVLNTFGHGTKEGFGSAGDYWEATVSFSNIQLKDTRSNKVFRVDDIQSYAKLEDSPAELDWTMLTVAVKSLQGALYLSQMQAASSVLAAASKGKKYVETWKADYTLDNYTVSPIEVAARHAAARFLQEVKLTNR
ncbi:MAG TPA: hypothetical protein VMW89_10305 [Desulfatiglandales bacterium]|nr:hypothetical protein [Desulfatiglandales bacterium]